MAETRTGFLSVSEGQIFWVHDIPNLPSTDNRPTLLFIHAGVADNTLWDDQVNHFTAKGWSTLRYDVLGYGRSSPNPEFLKSNPRPKLPHFEHSAQLVEHVLGNQANSEVLVIGLSRGGSAALDFAISHPGLVHGLVMAAGGLWGFDYPSNDPLEDALFEKEAALKEARDFEGLAELNVRVWGDGPLQEPGRVSDIVREKLYKWCIDIARKECDKVGGSALHDATIDPPAGKRLSELKIPVAVAIGLFDETCTNAGMRYVANQVESSELKEFETAHMINLELPQEFNSWLETWLDKNFAH